MRDFLNLTADMLGKASGSNSTRHNQSCTKSARHDRNICSSTSKGVVALTNGKWAAHVYVDNNWIRLGIFETEKEAAIAYESTIMTNWMECCKRYLQGISNGSQEPLTLTQASTDSSHSASSVKIPEVHGKQNCIRTHLFEKVLTPSDVSENSRLVIPKKFAGCFPCISNVVESSLEVPPVIDVELAFYDLSMKLWKFRYCYWKSSRTYTFSRGWRNFVEEKQLSSKDKVIFFKCERVEGMFIVDTHFMIDVEYHANKVPVEEVDGNTGDYVVPRSSKRVRNLQSEENGGGTAEVRHVKKIEEKKDLEGAVSGKAPETSFKLFGVKIA